MIRSHRHQAVGLVLALALLSSLSSFWLGAPVHAQDTTTTPAPTDITDPTEQANATATALAAETQVSDGPWSEPINLSRSGAASSPLIVTTPTTKTIAMWWDLFDGMKYTIYTEAEGWGPVSTAGSIVGTRAQNNELPVAPTGLRVLVDSAARLHAFWLDSRGNLMYAQLRTGASEVVWSGSVQIATEPLAWDAAVDAQDILHVAYVRTDQADALPAGIYYRRSTTLGTSWDNARALTTSLYFRSVDPDNAQISVVANALDEVLVGWEDPQLKRSVYAYSANQGASFDDPLLVEAAAAQPDLPVNRTIFATTADNRFLRLWQSGDACNLYQQQSRFVTETVNISGTLLLTGTVYVSGTLPLTDTVRWAPPVPVLDTLNGCAQSIQTYVRPDSTILLSAALASGQELALWDGERWSEVVTPRVTFLDPSNGQSSVLNCVSVAPKGDQIALIGCDANGDVWVTTSQVSVSELLPVLTTAWSPPSLISPSDADVDLPVVTGAVDNQVHILWGQVSAQSTVPSVYYLRTDGLITTAGERVLRGPNGTEAKQPSIVSDSAENLHALFTAGDAGQLYYSHSFLRDAASQNGWSSPAVVSGPDSGGTGWADLTGEGDSLFAVYAIPLNEKRGVYFLRSDDRGASWSEPALIFDAGAAGWTSVRQSQILLDARGRLHAVWVQTGLPPDNALLGIYYARSDDGGAHWTDPVEVSNGAGGWPQLVASNTDQLHLVWARPVAEDFDLLHRWSTDGGQTWSTPERIPDLRQIAPRVALATDGADGLYLLGLEQAVQGTGSLFYLRWNGKAWGDKENVPLGYQLDAASGVNAALVNSGKLAVVFRVRALLSTDPRYAFGYTERPIEVQTVAPVPTSTPLPAATATATATAAPTITPSPTPDLRAESPATLDKDAWLKIGGVLAGMALVVIIALFGLRSNRR